MTDSIPIHHDDLDIVVRHMLDVEANVGSCAPDVDWSDLPEEEREEWRRWTRAVCAGAGARGCNVHTAAWVAARGMARVLAEKRQEAEREATPQPGFTPMDRMTIRRVPRREEAVTSLCCGPSPAVSVVEGRCVEEAQMLMPTTRELSAGRESDPLGMNAATQRPLGAACETEARAILGGWWRSPDGVAKQAFCVEHTGAPVYLGGVMVGVHPLDSTIVWTDGTRTTVQEVAEHGLGWTAIGDNREAGSVGFVRGGGD